MITVSTETTLALFTCSQCGIGFGVPEYWSKARHRDHKTWYCPNGHGQYFPGKSDVEIAREKAARLERQLANRDEDLRVERASHAATKGQLTKVRRRVTNGACPCCNRTFANVGRHMKTQHPDAVVAASDRSLTP